MRRPTPLLPRDRLLAELTIQRKEWIVTYHEHDSLLENKAEEELTESERKAAWDDFETEKEGLSIKMQEFPALGSLRPEISDILAGLAGRSVLGIPVSNIAMMVYNSNPEITRDEFLGRLRLTVNFIFFLKMFISFFLILCRFLEFQVKFKFSSEVVKG